MDTVALGRLANFQAGVFTRSQAYEMGFTSAQVRRRINTGEWRVVFRSILTLRPGTVTTRQRDIAASLAVPGSALAGPSAARSHGVPVRDPDTYLWIGDRKPAPLPGVRYLRDPLWPGDVSPGQIVPLTTYERTIVDCLRVLPESEALILLDRALQEKWLTAAALAARATALTGRHGVTRLVSLVAAAQDGAHSVAERLAQSLLGRAGITGWIANHPVHDRLGLIGLGDLVFPAARLIVEIDGRAHHVSPDQFERDRSRQNRLVAAGWTVLRFTWRDLTQKSDRFVQLVRDMIAAPPTRSVF